MTINDKVTARLPIISKAENQGAVTRNGYHEYRVNPSEDEGLKTRFYVLRNDGSLEVVTHGDYDVKLTILDGEIISASFGGYARRGGR
mgnify:CR=1 FL=1